MTLPTWMKETDGALALVPKNAPAALLADLESRGIPPESYRVRLPDWAKMRADGVILVDPDIAYPAIIARLETAGCKPSSEPVDQMWGEIAYQAMKLELQRAMQRFGFAIKVLRRPKWALANLPARPGADAATVRRTGRACYRRLGLL